MYQGFFRDLQSIMGKLDYRTLRENVADEIRMKILNGDMKPGDKIIEQELASEFGISRGPVREALRQLEQEGMVEYSRNVGCSVKHIGMDDVYEIYYMRANYEMMAVRLYNAPFPQETIEKMEQVLEQMKQLHKEEYRKVFELDNEFHEAILDLVSFKRLKKAWEDLNYGNIVTGYNMEIDSEQVIKRQYLIHGKLLNACADIPCKAMENTDVLKKAVGEDTLIYEKKGQDAIHFHSYAKLLFSTNEMPQNLEDKSDAFYRRLLILDMNRVVKSGEKDLHLKEKVQAESDYAIHMAMIALKELYEQGKFTESEHSKECVREVQRSSDSICAFIDESLVRAKGKRLKRSEVFHMYEEFCKENGRQGHGKSNFFKNMTDKGFLLKQYNGEFYYQDIAVKEEDFCPVDPEERIPFEETDIDYKQLQLNMNQGIKGI